MSDQSAGPNGINARNLQTPGGLVLTGLGIGIGQAETGRPGLRFLPGGANFDDNDHSHPDVTPAAVFFRNGNAVANRNVTDHAVKVAGVMIANGAANKGVAPDAKLFASAHDAQAPDPDPDCAITAQHVALQNAGDVRAINLSFGNELYPGASRDGNSLLSRFVDWSARVHNVLYADTQGPGTPVPSDNYNGITVNASGKLPGGIYGMVDPAVNVFDQDADGPRRSVDIIAPGIDIECPTLGPVPYVPAHGTSVAAPHVTGTVALLQQYADDRIAAGAPRWYGLTEKRADHHLVMKAVLMNSADKVQDTGDGMEKTILDTGGNNWLVSDAYSNEAIPLHIQMGTGQLNAKRALKQFEPGEFNVDMATFRADDIPVIGWDYGELTNGVDSIHKYIFKDPLLGGSYIAITLAWDRRVLLNDTIVANGQYDIGENFAIQGLPDLDLLLLPKGATNLNQAVNRSVSRHDSVEHIFWQIPTTGEYEFWVHEFAKPYMETPPEPYGIAWWAKAAPRPPQMDPIPPQSGTVGIEVTFEVPVTDPDEGDLPTFSLIDGPPGALVASKIGSPYVGVFRWIPDTPGTYNFFVQATDTFGLSDQEPVTLTVS